MHLFDLHFYSVYDYCPIYINRSVCRANIDNLKSRNYEIKKIKEKPYEFNKLYEFSPLTMAETCSGDKNIWWFCFRVVCSRDVTHNIL